MKQGREEIKLSKKKNAEIKLKKKQSNKKTQKKNTTNIEWENTVYNKLNYK